MFLLQCEETSLASVRIRFHSLTSETLYSLFSELFSVDAVMSIMLVSTFHVPTVNVTT